MTSKTYTVDIDGIGAQGDGIGTIEGTNVFVAGALAGETVRAETTGDVARLVEVVRAGAERRQPLCRHFGACGGCKTQHMSEEANAAWKHGIVQQAFRHRGIDVAIEPVRQIGICSRRRAVLAAKMTGGVVRLGYRAAGSHDIVDMEMCPVLAPALENALGGLRAMLAAMLGEGESARLHLLAADNGIDVACSKPARQPDAGQLSRIAELAGEVPLVRLRLGGEPVMQRALPVLTIGGVPVAIGAEMFAQAVPEAERLLTELVVAGARGAKQVADLFSGAGTFTLGLARHARVLAVDGDGAAIAALDKAKGAAGLKPVETKVRDLFRVPLSRRELAAFEAVVFDPPRAGAKEQAEAIARSEVRVAIAVSCNPATLARDVRILMDGGFDIERVVPVDQFAFSPHVEAVAVLRRKGAKRPRRRGLGGA